MRDSDSTLNLLFLSNHSHYLLPFDSLFEPDQLDSKRLFGSMGVTDINAVFRISATESRRCSKSTSIYRQEYLGGSKYSKIDADRRQLTGEFP
jgi:hypothetical protein